MSLRSLKRNWRAVAWVAAVCGIALMPSARTEVDAQGRSRGPSPASTKADAASLQMGQYWTAEMMDQAIPMERTVEAWTGSAPASAVQNLGGGAAPGLAPGYDPDRALASFAAVVQRAPIQLMTSPPFAPPANPTDYGNYAPFQRWNQFGKYTTFPISTVGKLFFTQNGLNYVCSASIVNANTIATAGHCVHAGNNSAAGWSSNFVFCPSHNASGCVNGSWGWVYAATSGQWYQSGLPDRDYACISTNQPGGVQVGVSRGWTGRAWNFPTRQLEFALGYPQAAPFNGQQIQSTVSTEWYEQNFAADAPTNHLSKYIGSDQTGGSSGGPWWLSYRHPTTEYPDTDGSNLTDPGQGGGPFINGVNSHKRCNAGGCPAGSIFTQEMGSPQFLNTAGDAGEFEDVFALCAANGGQ